MTPSAVRLRRIRDQILAGGVGAYPTEGVWGLGCDPLNETAIRRIIRLKGRGSEKGLIVIAAGMDQLDGLVRWPTRPSIRQGLAETWPGPVTWVMEAAPDLPAILTGGRPTIAVRVTHHAPVISLCRAAGTALVSTSANFSGRPARKRRWQVMKDFGVNLDWLLPGPLGGQRGPSEIRDAATGRVLRAAAPAPAKRP
ncbi:UNVERIFIED_CONTAM: L-threonylcarbamoyladenylate synthase [Spiribacter pallidus]|uniref:L-threonylcarbamoyladenylate synthase n=1 Tax=Spiribacter pallidus TaxID=1987936 RepID=UPI00349F797F